MLRALTLADVIAQLQQDSGQIIAFNPNEVINQFTGDEETLIVGGETFTASKVTNYPVNVVQDVGPVGYWRMDDPAGATTVYDSSPFASATYPKVPGTILGGVTLQAAGAMPGSKGVTLDGTSGYIEVPNTGSLQRVGDLSIELWFKPSSLAAAQAMVSKGPTGEYHLVLNPDGSVTLKMGPSYVQVVLPASTITTGTWYHLVVTRRAIDKTVNVYLNGTSRYSGTYTTAPTVTTNVLRIGAASPTVSNYFAGTLDEVAIYARPLSATQVSNHWAWAHATDCGSTAYGSGKYGYVNYPKPGAAAGAIYGDASTTYGNATYV